MARGDSKDHDLGTNNRLDRKMAASWLSNTPDNHRTLTTIDPAGGRKAQQGVGAV